MTLTITPKVRTPAADYLNLNDIADGEFLKRVGDSLEGAAAGGGSGDVTAAANIADNAAVRGDGGLKGVQASDVAIDDPAGNITTVRVIGDNELNLKTANNGGGTSRRALISSGSASGTSGDVEMDAGAGTLASGDVELGRVNAEQVNVGRSGKPTNVRGFLALSQQLRLTGEYSGAGGNNVAIGDVGVVRLTSGGLTGMAGGVAGRVVVIVNGSGGDLTLTHDATSTAANRLFCPGGNNITLSRYSMTIAMYDATDSRWRVMDPSAGAGGSGLTEAEVYGRLVAWGVL
jgi:hypothetical protein